SAPLLQLPDNPTIQIKKLKRFFGYSCTYPYSPICNIDKPALPCADKFDCYLKHAIRTLI
ncbi:hypothetical protein, partial [Phascolarctobacterium succinatutens]|uniref:hypothetical protein n=1 Tax=Phascolarctobacterium succinatutens TaxID=626940 RepID=UPI003AF8805D